MPSNLTHIPKKVPDWLNSSLWSTTATPPPHAAVTTTLDRNDQTPLPRRDHDSPPDSPITRPPPHLPAPTRPESVSPKIVPNGTTCSSSESDQIDSGAPVVNGPSPEDIARHSQLLVEVSKKVINMKEVRSLAAMGVPDTPGVRSTVWKLLLGYLPSDRTMWPAKEGPRPNCIELFMIKCNMF